MPCVCAYVGVSLNQDLHENLQIMQMQPSCSKLINDDDDDDEACYLPLSLILYRIPNRTRDTLVHVPMPRGGASLAPSYANAEATTGK